MFKFVRVELMNKPYAIDRIRVINELNIKINSVVDVGVFHQTHFLRSLFSDKKHYLIEPIEEHNDIIMSNYMSKNIEFEILNYACSDTNGTLKMNTKSVNQGTSITHAYPAEESSSDFREVEQKTLDTLLSEHKIEAPILLKIDVDGMEPKILNAAQEMLKLTSILIIEANINNVHERMGTMKNLSFRLFDIFDMVYYDRRLRQFDLIFINDKIFHEMKLDMYKMPFDPKKWTPYTID